MNHLSGFRFIFLFQTVVSSMRVQRKFTNLLEKLDLIAPVFFIHYIFIITRIQCDFFQSVILLPLYGFGCFFLSAKYIFIFFFLISFFFHYTFFLLITYSIIIYTTYYVCTHFIIYISI